MLKKIVITLGILLVVLLASAAIIPLVFKKEIVAKVKTSIKIRSTPR